MGRAMTASESALGVPSDQQLAVAAKAGDHDAFTALVGRHRGAVFGLALALLGERDEADEAAQEAFVRAYERLHRYDPRRGFCPWVRGIAAKVCLEFSRRRARAGTAPLAVDAARSNDRAAHAREGLASLPWKLRVALTLFYLEDASVKDVAETLQISPGAVRVRLHRGRRMLREKLRAVMDEGGL